MKISFVKWLKEFSFVALVLFCVPLSFALFSFLGFIWGYNLLIQLIFLLLWFSPYRNRLILGACIALFWVVVWNYDGLRSFDRAQLYDAFSMIAGIVEFYFSPFLMIPFGFMEFFSLSTINISVSFQRGFLAFSLLLLFTASLPIRCLFMESAEKRQLLWRFWGILWFIESFVVFVLMNSAGH